MRLMKELTNTTEATTIAAIENPFPFPFLLFARESPMPPNIQPRRGLINAHTNPAIAMPLLCGSNDCGCCGY